MKNIWLVVIVVLLVAAGLMAFMFGKDNSSKTSDQQTSTPTSEADNADDKTDKETIALASVGGHTGTGTASRELDNSLFEHKVEADLPDPAPEDWEAPGT